MYITKKDTWGKVIRYKTQLPTDILSQVAIMDFNKFNVLVAEFITTKCILAIEMAMDLEIYQIDIKDGVLEVEMTMTHL